MSGSWTDLDAVLGGPVGRARIYQPCETPAPPAVPLDLDAADSTTDAELARRYVSDGYAVFSLTSTSPPGADVPVRIGHRLELGDPFVPPMYREPTRSATYAGNGVNVIAAADGGRESPHPAFETSGGQALHCDGTLQAIGEVPTAILVCASPARQGGETVVFKAVAAFTALASENPSLALALTTDCLRRTATVSLGRQSAIGPAFALRDGDILSRYSVGAADEWVADDAPHQRAAMVRAAERLLQFTLPGSDFVRSVRLEHGQGLVIANDRVAHGRTPYTDGPNQRRTLFRALFRQRLSARVTRA